MMQAVEVLLVPVLVPRQRVATITCIAMTREMAVVAKAATVQNQQAGQVMLQMG